MTPEDFLSIIGESWKLARFNPMDKPLTNYQFEFMGWIAQRAALAGLTTTDLITMDNQQLADILTGAYLAKEIEIPNAYTLSLVAPTIPPY